VSIYKSLLGWSIVSCRMKPRFAGGSGAVGGTCLLQEVYIVLTAINY